MKKSNGAMLVAAALLTLGTAYTSGTTNALWTQSAQLDGATVKSGDLNASGMGGATWTNVTTPGASVILPGETIRVSQPLDVAVKGNNLKARLKAYLSGGANPNITSARWRLLDKSGAEVISWRDAGTAGDLLLTQGDGKTALTLDGVKDFTMEGEITYSSSMSGTYTYNGNYTVDVYQVVA